MDVAVVGLEDCVKIVGLVNRAELVTFNIPAASAACVDNEIFVAHKEKPLLYRYQLHCSVQVSSKKLGNILLVVKYSDASKISIAGQNKLLTWFSLWWISVCRCSTLVIRLVYGYKPLLISIVTPLSTHNDD